MPKLTKQIENNRPLISVFISKDKESFEQIANDIEKLGTNRFTALVDTGATNCTITKEVVERLDLDIVGKRAVASASHIVDANIYNIWLSVPVEKLISKQEDTGEITPVGMNIAFSFHDIQVSEMNTSHQGIDMLLGMDVLQGYLLVFNNGSFTVSF